MKRVQNRVIIMNIKIIQLGLLILYFVILPTQLHIFADEITPVYGIISFVSGDVSITKKNKKTNALLSMKVELGDSISTQDGILRIQIADSYICHIEKNTSITFRKILEKTNLKSYNIYLHKGQILSRLVHDKNKSSELMVITPVVTAAVRGTDFMVSESNSNEQSIDKSAVPSGVYVSSGSVDVEGGETVDNQKINLRSGEQAVIKPGELRKSLLDDMIKAKMKILNELKIMKEFNCKLIEEQQDKNRKLLEEFK